MSSTALTAWISALGIVLVALTAGFFQVMGVREQKRGEREHLLINALQDERIALSSQLSSLASEVRTLRNEVHDYYEHSRNLEAVYYVIKAGLEDGSVPPLPPLPAKNNRNPANHRSENE